MKKMKIFMYIWSMLGAWASLSVGVWFLGQALIIIIPTYSLYKACSVIAGIVIGIFLLYVGFKEGYFSKKEDKDYHQR